MTDEERRELAELFREDDRLRAENADYLARRKAERLARENAEAEPSPPVEKSNGFGLVYRDQENAMAAAPLGEPEVFNAGQCETLAMIIAEARKDWDAEAATEMAALRNELERLEQRVLNSVVRLIRPGETAEAQCLALNDRLAILEGKVTTAITHGRRKRV